MRDGQINGADSRKAVSAGFSKWMRETRQAAAHLCAHGGLYGGVDGCRRFARECAPAILDFGDYGRKNIGSTYGGVCVISYDLKPPVDAKQWVHLMLEKIAEMEKPPFHPE